MKNVKVGHTSPIVCLDAGHYGKYNRSPAGPVYYESEMTWKLQQLLKEELISYGIIVATTRKNQDVDMGLKARGMASKDCDLFVSIHSNAVPGGQVNDAVDYVVVYHQYEDDGTDVDDKSKEFANLIAPVIASVMETKQDHMVSTRKGSGDWNSDGVMNDNYYSVLNGSRLVETPGVILEHSFHTNTRIVEWLLVEDNLKKLAKAEAEAIAVYFDIAQQNTVTPPSKFLDMKIPVLKKGMTSDSVMALRALLEGYGYDCSGTGTDGLYTAALETVVIAYQLDHELDGDGSVGRATWTSLLRL